MRKRSVIEPMRLEDILKLDQALRQSRLGVQMAEAMAGEAITLSIKTAQVHYRKLNGEKEIAPQWRHVIVERFPVNPDCKSRKESWVMFSPED